MTTTTQDVVLTAESMRRLVLEAPSQTGEMADAKLKVETVPMPKPKSGEVLIKVAAAPINPSVFGAWKKSNSKPGPQGNEGSGVIVASGGGFFNTFKVGQKVGFVNSSSKQGSYSEYVTANVTTAVFSLPQELPVESGASFFVNPYTAVGMLDTAVSGGHTGFVHTGAASQLGQMLVKLCAQPSHRMTIINVVRRQEQAELLRKIGAVHVIVTSEDDWVDKLGALVKELKISLAFDCVAGETTGKIVSQMPPKSTTYVYGALSGWTVDGISATDMIYHGKQVKGWLLTRWLKRGNTLQLYLRVRAASKLVNSGLGPGGWAESRFLDTTLDTAWADFLKQSQAGTFTDAKLRIRLSPGDA